MPQQVPLPFPLLISSPQTLDNNFRKFANKVNVEKYDGPKMQVRVVSFLHCFLVGFQGSGMRRVEEGDRARTHDKSDRATTELVRRMTSLVSD